MVRGTFSPARAWRPAVVARLAQTLGRKNHEHQMPRVQNATSRGQVRKSVRCVRFAQPAVAGSQFVGRARRRAARRTPQSKTRLRPLISLPTHLSHAAKSAMESGEYFKSSLLSHSHARSGSSWPQLPAMLWPFTGTHAGAIPCRCLAGDFTRVMLLHVSSFVFPCAPRQQLSLRPNPSFKRSAQGRPPGPLCGAQHFPQRGPGGLPLAPA